MKKIVSVVVAVLANGLVFGFELVGEKNSATIVVAKDAEESSILAAQEITNYVARLTGRILPIVTAVPEKGAAILIGTRAKFPGTPPKAALAKLNGTKKTESYWIGVNANRMCIVGWEEVAELYGAYHFLESKLGIRWFQMATKDDPGDYVPPRRETIDIAPYVEFREPAFTERNLDMCCAATQIPARRSQELYLRNGYRINSAHRWWPKEKVRFPAVGEYYGPRVPRRSANLGGGHCIFLSCWPNDEKHFKEHPEYFALVDGKRVMGKQHCYSNTNLLNMAADRAIAMLDSYNGLGQYCFALWDTASGACQCEKCEAMSTPYETQRGIESTRFHTFVNYIADRIWAKWPEANLLYLAYWTYRMPADKRVKHDPRLRVQYCDHGRCYGHSIDDPKCARNVPIFKEMQEWTKIAPYVYTYEYFSPTPSSYCGGDLSFARDLKTYHRIGLVGWKEEAVFADSALVGPSRTQEHRDRMPSTWQRMWIAGKLSWDITLDENALLEECESKYYGAAYPAMKKYQDLRRRLWDSNRNCIGFPTGDQRSATLLNNSEAKESLYAFLDEADRQAGDDGVLKHRIADDRRWLTEYWVKPNDKLRATAGKAMIAPKVEKGAIVVDGDGSDWAWAAAAYADDFQSPGTYAGREVKSAPKTLATSVGVLQDGENIYFLVTAKEPATAKLKAIATKDLNVYADDSVEIFLYPPAMDNRYYHIAVNTKGDVYDAKCPGNESVFDFGVEAKCRVLGDRYVIEICVPSKNMHPLVEGETWKLNVARNRTIYDDLKQHGQNWSLGAAAYHDTLAYRSLNIGGGKPLVVNGAFELLDEKGRPKNWAIAYGKAEIVEESGNRFLRFSSDSVYEYLALGQPKEPVKIRYSFRARGKGKVKTFFYSFSDTPSARAKHGYDRKFNENHPGETFVLTDEWRSYTGEFVNPPDECCALAFTNDGKDCRIDIDDIAVNAVK